MSFLVVVQIMPPYFYILTLPRLLLLSLPLIIFALTDKNARERTKGLKGMLLVPSLGMIVALSGLGHKVSAGAKRRKFG